MRRKLLLLLLSLIAGFAVAEVAVRAIDPLFFVPPVRIYDPVVGWRAFPGLNENRDGVQVTINSAGFRDREQRPKASGVRRLLVLGDSFTEATQVDLDATFWQQAVRKVAAAGGQRWEAVSLGVSDFGSLQEVLLFEREGLALEPDAILFQVFPFNDIYNNALAGAHLFSNHDAYRPYLDPSDGFRSVTYLAPATSWLRRHSALGRFAILACTQRGVWWGGERFFRDDAERLERTNTLAVSMGYSEKLKRIALLLNVFAADADQLPMVRQGWQATEAAFERLLARAGKDGIPVYVLVAPHDAQLAPSLLWRRKHLPFAVDPRSAGERLARIAGDRAKVVDLVDLFDANIQLVLPFTGGHFNVAAHGLAADAVAAAMLARAPRQESP